MEVSQRKLRGGAVITIEFFLSGSCDDLGCESASYRPPDSSRLSSLWSNFNSHVTAVISALGMPLFGKVSEIETPPPTHTHTLDQSQPSQMSIKKMSW